MHRDELTPFPTPVEIIRVIANAFDSKQSNKALDEKVYDTNVDYRQIEKFVVDCIEVPLEKKIHGDLSRITVENIENLIAWYVDMIQLISLDCVSRSDSLPLLAELWFPPFAVIYLNYIHQNSGGPRSRELVSGNDFAVSVAIDWIAEHEIKWREFVKSCNKNEIDLLSSWKRGHHIPSLQRISSIDCWTNTFDPKDLDWSRVKTLLIVARAIDWFRKTELGKRAISEVRNLYWSVKPQRDLSDELERCQLKNNRRYEGIVLSLREIEIAMFSLIHCEEINHGQLEKELQRVKNLLKHSEYHEGTSYRLNLYEAQWQVFRGNLDIACKHYRKAFKGSLYRGGKYQEQIINQALVVASSLKHPDKVFLKQLKNQAILFGLEMPVISNKVKKRSYRHSTFVEKWEIDMWKSHMNHYFPCYESSIDSRRTGPVLLSVKDFKPDYRYPNRRMKIGMPWKKSMPQLIWSVLFKEVDIVKKLLDKGADVNRCSVNNETAIGVAVENLQVDNYPTSEDFEIFQLLAKQAHKEETLNKRTVKKKLLPIMSSVGTGRTEIVEQLLKMGADPDKRGPDDQTPLYVCIFYLVIVTNLKGELPDIKSMPVSREVLDSLRRNTGGHYGFTLKQQIVPYLSMINHPLFNVLNSLWTENTMNRMSVDSLHDIVKLLLDYGADPNAVQACPLPGYTPLMYAAEVDESRLFEMMLANGGDPLKTYKNPYDGRMIGCMQIAQEFKSYRVLKILNSVLN